MCFNIYSIRELPSRVCRHFSEKRIEVRVFLRSRDQSSKHQLRDFNVVEFLVDGHFKDEHVQRWAKFGLIYIVEGGPLARIYPSHNELVDAIKQAKPGAIWEMNRITLCHSDRFLDPEVLRAGAPSFIVMRRQAAINIVDAMRADPDETTIECENNPQDWELVELAQSLPADYTLWAWRRHESHTYDPDPLPRSHLKTTRDSLTRYNLIKDAIATAVQAQVDPDTPFDMDDPEAVAQLVLPPEIDALYNPHRKPWEHQENMDSHHQQRCKEWLKGIEEHQDRWASQAPRCMRHIGHSAPASVPVRLPPRPDSPHPFLTRAGSGVWRYEIASNGTRATSSFDTVAYHRALDSSVFTQNTAQTSVAGVSEILVDRTSITSTAGAGPSTPSTVSLKRRNAIRRRSSAEYWAHRLDQETTANVSAILSSM